jgi:hypothetical protein
MAWKTDYEAARGYLNKKTLAYAREILPKDVAVRVLISGDIDKHVHPDRGKATIAATIPENPDWSKAVVVYNRKYLTANIYNILSYFFEALIVHELCHIKFYREHPDITEPVHSGEYRDCVLYFLDEKWAAEPITHPDRYDFRAYHGSSDLVVPWYIGQMGLFFCESCERLYMFNRKVHEYEIPACPNCGEVDRKRWIGLSAENVYRLATANRIKDLPGEECARITEFIT